MSRKTSLKSKIRLEKFPRLGNPPTELSAKSKIGRVKRSPCILEEVVVLCQVSFDGL
ncbi:hypothetical protein [Anabaena sp. UHCC 0399]|uniref:hypothetical protein n=1 Tax=Anabaena sp. UHCC 0399 TaxID=3110238 RepID=UPI002B20F436|nr:hypothetical protein [Anabaena sp. UHCC 0399]MEA5564658.1 hypothetical protein [Anabaena sp. UHCC 0399]